MDEPRTPEVAPPVEVVENETRLAEVPQPPAPSEVDATELEAQRARFRDAHRLQYAAPPSASLDAWDRFLRDVPTGPLADEARYYRALSLVRVGRVDEARRVLEAIAEGRHGAARRADARRALDRLAP